MPATLALAVAFTLAAPVLPDEKPKPRAKLLGTVKLDKRVEQVVWTPDGKHLVLITDAKGLVIGRDQLGEDAAPKPVAEFDLPAGGGSRFGVTPDGAELYAVVDAGGRFNAETRLCVWDLKALLTSGKAKKPDRAVSLEVDNPAGFTFAADGKRLYAAVSEPKGAVPPGQPVTNAGRVVRLSTKTGDQTDEVKALDEDGSTFVGAAVHPTSGRLVAQFHNNDKSTVRGYDLTTGKPKWEKEFAPSAQNSPGNVAPRVSPDGGVVAVVVSRQFNVVQGAAQPGQPPPVAVMYCWTPKLLHAATGEEIADLGADDVTWSDLSGFSADGKLLFGWMNRPSGTHFVLWETKTGKPLKTWTRGSGDQSAAFAPAGHELAVVERTSTPIYAQGSDPQFGVVWDRPVLGGRNNQLNDLFIQPAQQVIRTDHTSVVGVWDLAPLLK